MTVCLCASASEVQTDEIEHITNAQAGPLSILLLYGVPSQITACGQVSRAVL